MFKIPGSTVGRIDVTTVPIVFVLVPFALEYSAFNLPACSVVAQTVPLAVCAVAHPVVLAQLLAAIFVHEENVVQLFATIKHFVPLYVLVQSATLCLVSHVSLIFSMHFCCPLRYVQLPLRPVEHVEEVSELHGCGEVSQRSLV